MCRKYKFVAMTSLMIKDNVLLICEEIFQIYHFQMDTKQ